MRRLRLRFEDSELEASFLAKEGRDVLPSVRLGLLAALGLTLAFVAIDALVAEHRLLQAELIHAADMVAIVGLVWATLGADADFAMAGDVEVLADGVAGGVGAAPPGEAVRTGGALLAVGTE